MVIERKYPISSFTSTVMLCFGGITIESSCKISDDLPLVTYEAAPFIIHNHVSYSLQILDVPCPCT